MLLLWPVQVHDPATGQMMTMSLAGLVQYERKASDTTHDLGSVLEMIIDR